MLVDGWSTAAMTEDGGGGQWFMGGSVPVPGRHRPALPELADVPQCGKQRFVESIVAQLNITDSPESRPRQFNAAFTRYLLDRIA